MNMQTHNFKNLILVSFISTFLFACSVEKKPETTTDNSSTESSIVIAEDEPPMITNPEDIVLPPASNLPEPYQEQESLPPIVPKPNLTKQQLFAGALNAHNHVRAKHGLQPLKWSDKLAAYSQEWADHLGRGKSCKMYHRSGSPPYGENLYISSPIIWTENNKEVARERNQVNIKSVVKAWTDEEQWYNYKTNSCQPGRQCGHYTQVVWRETTEVGCAVKFCGDQSQNWVCSYNPPGNYTGKRPY